MGGKSESYVLAVQQEMAGRWPRVKSEEASSRLVAKVVIMVLRIVVSVMRLLWRQPQRG